MKTTLELPPELVRAVKLRAVMGGRKLKDEVADLLRTGLAREAATPSRARRRVKLPLVRCARKAQVGQEVTPERAADILLEEEAEASGGAVR